MEHKEEVILRLENFSLQFREGGRWLKAVDEIDLEIFRGEMIALIGESGCGKSVTALSVMGLQSPAAGISGVLEFEGRDLGSLTPEDWTKLRGNEISMIFQEPMTALNPLIKVGRQIREAALTHRKISRKKAKELTLAIMKQAGLPDVEALYECYPHQLSGGQRQRIMIAMAFINSPDLLIADEPTTALDVTIQAQIMELMKKMNRETNSAVLLISHDLGLVRRLCSRAYIMYAGRIVEEGRVEELLSRPMHPYTRGLAAAIPAAGKRGEELTSIPGTVPALEDREGYGCGFYDRCPYAMPVCREKTPLLQRKEEAVWFSEAPLKEISLEQRLEASGEKGRRVACHLERIPAAYEKSDGIVRKAGQ